MENELWVKVLGVLLGLVLITAFSVLAGTVVFFLWPVAIPTVFPRIVKEGWLAARVTWWQAVAFTWLIAFLFNLGTGKRSS